MRNLSAQKGYNTSFCRKFLVSQKRNKYQVNPLVFQKVLAIKKVLCMRVGISWFSVEQFLSHSSEKVLRRTLECFRKFWASTSFMNQRVISMFFLDFSLSHSRDKYVGEPFRVSESLEHQKFLRIRGGFHDFLSEIWWSHKTKKFCKGTFVRFAEFGFRQFLCTREDVEIFVSHYRKSSRANRWRMFQEISDTGKFSCTRLVSHDSQGNFSVSDWLRISESFAHKSRKTRFCVVNSLSHSSEKSLKRTRQCFKRFWAVKILCIRDV